MSDPTPSQDRLTEMLAEASGGNVEALNRVFPLVYEELRRVARNRLRSEREGHTLGATALVHEAYLKLVDQRRTSWRSRSHFYAVAARAMRRILVNHALARGAAKRGGGAEHLPLDAAALAPPDPDALGLVPPDLDAGEALALGEALERLEAFNPRGAQVVTWRFFGGLAWDEVADVMEISPVTARRSWTAARAWLRRELRPSGGTTPPGRPAAAPEARA